jgi:hypothetical protein
MANIKITDLTAYGNPTSTDVLPIVDVGADVTKKVSVADLLENAGSGTAAAPGIAFDGDSNTGIYRPGTDQVALSTNGTERVEFGTSEVVFNDGGENYDFRVEGDTNSSLFFVDASADAVGIGITSPNATLEVIGDVKIGETSSYLLRFAAGSSTGVVEFPSTSVRSVVRTLGATPLEFEINSSPVARFDTSGRLLVGTSSDSGGALLQVNGDRIRVATAKTPASASDTGTAGEICWDASYIYVCTATNTWKRAALSTW